MEGCQDRHGISNLSINIILAEGGPFKDQILIVVIQIPFEEFFKECLIFIDL